MPTYLDNIVSAVAEDLEIRKSATSPAQLTAMIDDRPPARDFVGALRAPGMGLIAEIKRASPSKGELNLGIDAVAQARAYEQAGATAISVLTESRFFKGSLADLATVAAAVSIPCLRKDFVIDAYQLYEARAYGADAVLLIAAILADQQLVNYLDITRELGLGALIEVHDEAELSRVLNAMKHPHPSPLPEGEGKRTAAPIALGINNRNLVDFSVDIGTTLRLRASVPAGVTLVSESGIHAREDVLRLAEAGIDAILVGEALVTSADPRDRIRELLG